MGVAKPEQFLNSIIKAKSISEIVTKTKMEKNYLENEYNTIASLKNGFTIYRNYLKANILPSKQINKKPVLQIILNELRLSSKQQTIFNKNKNTDIKENKSNLRSIYDLNIYLDKAIKLLDSTSYLDNILGLCALTGRRVAEITCSAQFKYIDKETIEFIGQLKTKERIDVLPYQIPVLYNANQLIITLAKIRKTKPQFINNQKLFHNATSNDLSIRVKKHFEGLFEELPKVKDLRAIYALICFSNFNKIPTNKKIDRDVYFSKILGHSKDDIITCGSYVDFYLNY